MLSPILAFRPATVVERLGPRNLACPLSARDLLGPAAELGLALPVIRAPIAGVARGALVAAKQLQAALGLALPPATPAEPWFAAVASAADEVAAGLPIVLCAEVVVAGEGAIEVERAFHEAWRLVGAGLTHLAVDVAAVPAHERGRVLAEVGQAGAQNGISVDAVIPMGEGPQAAARAAAMLEEAARRGVQVDVASLRCPAPADAAEAKLQVAALARMCQALQGLAVMRRGPVTPALLEAVRGSPLRACDDGGAAAERALESLVARASPAEPPARESALERAAAGLSEAAAARLEARAYGEALDFLERLGAQGSAPSLARALERRLVDR